MRPYFELNALPPEAFLKPESFVTEYDGRDPNRAEEQYREGLRLSAEYGRIIIRANSMWAAEEGAYDPVTRVRLGRLLLRRHRIPRPHVLAAARIPRRASAH